VSSSPSGALQSQISAEYAALNLPGKPGRRALQSITQSDGGIDRGIYGTISTRRSCSDSLDGYSQRQSRYIFARITIGFSAPPLYLPSANATISGSQPLFSWGKTGGTPEEIAQFPGTVVQPLHYILQVDDDSLFGSVDFADTGSAVSHQFAGLLAEGVWFWRVSARNDRSQHGICRILSEIHDQRHTGADHTDNSRSGS